ncbi:COP23 domain-containing protein [Microcoleus sp. FACHB-SPT15]|uniref:COP23 domain-containing protein n=1 Tax=Microcoleus sp. FACHB-SPT15 TaxID=2692830 RepID=UPI001F548E70|nr:COP23 domain-containing protein [Microcoleus sp. FACHB-SPT15]
MQVLSQGAIAKALFNSTTTAAVVKLWRIKAMTLRQLNHHSGLMSLVFKSVSLSTGVAILIASSGALAFNPHPEPATLQKPRLQNTTLAADIEGKTEPQSSQGDVDASEEPRFSCELVDGEYTVMYHPESQPSQAYAWATPTALGGGWTSERRCDEISRRLELYRPDGLLEMQTSVENNLDIVCVTTQQDPACRIVLTVPPGQDAQLTRDRVFENLTVADSGQTTDAVNTFVDGDRDSQLLNQVINQGLSVLGIDNKPTRRSSSRNINLRPFLDRTDGGTGTQLQGGIPMRSNPRLNPNRFR